MPRRIDVDAECANRLKKADMKKSEDLKEVESNYTKRLESAEKKKQDALLQAELDYQARISSAEKKKQEAIQQAELDLQTRKSTSEQMKDKETQEAHEAHTKRLDKIKLFKEQTIQAQAPQERMTKFDREIAELKKKQKERLSTKPDVIPTRDEIEKKEEEKKEEVRGERIASIFNAFDFGGEEEEEEEDETPADELDSDEERELAELNAKIAAERAAKKENKTIVLSNTIPSPPLAPIPAPPSPSLAPTPTPPPKDADPPSISKRTEVEVEPELTEEERKKLREESLAEDRKVINLISIQTAKQSVQNMYRPQKIELVEEEQERPQLISNTKVKKPVKVALKK